MASTAMAQSTVSAHAQLAAQHGLSVAGMRPRLPAYLRLVWKYRHFTGTFATAGVVASLNHHRLGRMWQVLTPLTNAGVYYLIFGVIIGSSRGVHNFIAYLCIGIFFFTFTSQASQNGVTAITKNIGLVRVLQFPRASLPMSSTLAQLQNLMASLIVLVGIVLVTREPVRWSWLMIIPLLLLQTTFNLGLAMIFARIGNKITDLKQIMPFAMRVWMYSSGVMYAASNFTAHLPSVVAKIAIANPLVVYIEIARQSLLSNENMIMSWRSLWILGTAWAMVIGIGGFIYFWRGEQEYGRG